MVRGAGSGPDNGIANNRVVVLFFVFLLFIALIGYRITAVQVVRSGELEEVARAERTDSESVPARRGEIFDARGQRLATNMPATRLSAVLAEIQDKAAFAAAIAPLIDRSAEDVLAALEQPGAAWVVLARRLNPEVTERIRALGLAGVFLDPEPSRVYPFGELASHVLGFTTYDMAGAYGLEGEYDAVVGGSAGTLVAELDGSGNIIGISPSRFAPPIDGSDLVLTIDSAVQYIIEDVLEKTIAAQGAEGGTIIVQDPRTGAILGMASRPAYDPNAFVAVDDASVFLNPAISFVYEPGSTFKSIVMAIGLDDGVVTPDTIHNDAPGYVEVPGFPPITNNNGRVWGDETMWNVLEHSTNLGAIFVAERIGRDRFYQRLTDFGIGMPTGVDLQGEEAGILTLPFTDGWNDVLFYTNAFGQGVAVTPLQLTNAVSAIVNGGRLMQPYVVAQVRHADGTTESHQPVVVRNVISERTSEQMRLMLESVVVNGTGTYAAVAGYRIGAKTGTAQVPSPDGGYIEDATIASIVGFAPVEDPRFTVLVKIDWPKESPWGETVGGPALAEVFARLFDLYGIAPSRPVEE
ncbi:MAG: penicillin-binding protein 2 [Chloroflexi bacterium]|nr:MAG: penicillin-binding protein 2 [Chloroflexota bacterium]